MKKNIISILIFFIVIAFFAPLDINAIEPKPLEVKYPDLPPIETPTNTVTLPDYVKYIYWFFIATSGIIALVVLALAGLQYLASTGMPEKMRDAKDKIWAAVFGLLILSCSWLILHTINPQLTYLQIPGQTAIPANLTPGVYLCKRQVDIRGFWSQRQSAQNQSGDELNQTAQRLSGILKTIEENCYLVEESGNIRREFEDEVKVAYLVPAYGNQQYGSILYEETNFEGKGGVIYQYSAGQNPTQWSIPGQISSIQPFILNFEPSSSWYIKLFKLVRYNIDNLNEETKECKPGQGGNSPAVGVCQGLPEEIGSQKIEGDLFIVFFKESTSQGQWNLDTDIDVFTISDSNLNDNLMGLWKKDQCVERREPQLEDRTYPCAEMAVVVAADFY